MSKECELQIEIIKAHIDKLVAFENNNPNEEVASIELLNALEVIEKQIKQSEQEVERLYSAVLMNCYQDFHGEDYCLFCNCKKGFAHVKDCVVVSAKEWFLSENQGDQ